MLVVISQGYLDQKYPTIVENASIFRSMLAIIIKPVLILVTNIVIVVKLKGLNNHHSVKLINSLIKKKFVKSANYKKNNL
jgi:hypothetical protein